MKETSLKKFLHRLGLLAALSLAAAGLAAPAAAQTVTDGRLTHPNTNATSATDPTVPSGA